MKLKDAYSLEENLDQPWQHIIFFFNFTLFYFTILYWFCHTSAWIRHRCTWVPNPEPPSHLPPHTISLGYPCAPAPSILYPASNLDWRFISYVILYMFQCHSPKSSHPLPLDSILKSTDITLPTKVHLVKAMVFPVVMYGCESWTIKKSERQRIDAFELWCWRRLLRVPWTARRSNQSILKEISPEYSLEGLMLKLKHQYWPPDEKNWLIGKDPDAGKDWRQEEKGTTEDKMVRWQHQLDGHEFEQASGVGDGQGSLAYCSPWGCKESDTTEQLYFLNTLNTSFHFLLSCRVSVEKSADSLMGIPL